MAERIRIDRAGRAVVVAAAETVEVPPGFDTPLDDATMRRPLD